MPSDKNSHLTTIRFFGIMDEKQNFTRLPGYTVDEHTEAAPKGESRYKVVLQNTQKKEIASFVPDINFEMEGCLDRGELKTSIVEADIPLKENGETIALMYEGKTLYEEVVDKEVPQIEEITVEPFKGTAIPETEMGEFGFAELIDTEDSWSMKNAKLIIVNWKVKSSKEKTHIDILLLGDSGIYGEVATDLAEGPYVMNLAGLSSSYSRIVVRASNGFQSANTSSKKISTRSLPPKLEIIDPKEGKGLQAYSPFDLRATIIDTTEKNPEKKLVWLINGKIIQRGGNLAMASSLKPGKYRIEAIYQSGKRMAKSQINILILQPDKVYEKWLKEAERF